MTRGQGKLIYVDRGERLELAKRGLVVVPLLLVVHVLFGYVHDAM